MRRAAGFNRRLTVTMSLLVIGTAVGFVVGGWFLLVAPSVTRVALSRIEHAGVILEKELDRQFLQAERLLFNARRWIVDEEIALGHTTLNHRFMPVLSQFSSLSLVLIAESSGKEWMLMRTNDGQWENQLTPPAGVAKGRARFLTETNQLLDALAARIDREELFLFASLQEDGQTDG